MIRPILDRVLLRRIKEKQEGPIVKPDAYHESMRFEVVQLGDFAIVAGQRYPQVEFVRFGDVVLVHQYDIEEIPVDGETLYLTRIQNIKGVECVKITGRVDNITRTKWGIGAKSSSS